MTRLTLLTLAAWMATSIAFEPAQAAEPRVVHGSSDAFSTPGVALAWGILRGANESTTFVDIRVLTDPSQFSSMTAVGRDPFTNREQTLPHRSPMPGRFELRVPRAQFADFPRTELRFFGSVASADSDPPTLVVFFLGVPDTTPELANDAALDASLSDRIARIRPSRSNSQ